MQILAKDIMVKDFDTINVNAPAADSIQMILNGKTRDTGHKTISLMVIDDFNHLVGVVTMFDILYHLRPPILNYGVEGTELSWDGQLKILIETLKGKTIEQLMSNRVFTAEPNEHIMVLIDRMVKHKIRRLPIIDNSKPIGIVYISDIYHRLFQ